MSINIKKVLHIKIRDAQFIIKGNYNDLVNYVDFDILTKNTIRNIIMKMIGETPISYHKTNTLREEFDNGCLPSEYYEIYKHISELVDLSLYRIYDDYFYHGKDDKIFYITEFRQGKYCETNSEGKGLKPIQIGKQVGNFFLKSCIEYNYDRLKKQIKVNDELFDEFLRLLEKSSGLDTRNHSLSEITLKIHTCINDSIKDSFKDLLNKYDIKGGYFFNTIQFIIDPMSMVKRKDEKTGLYEVSDVRLSRGRKPFGITIDVKHSITFNGEIIVPITSEIYDKLKTWYSFSSCFDNGIAYIDSIIDVDDYNSEYFIANGFKHSINLKETPHNNEN